MLVRQRAFEASNHGVRQSDLYETSVLALFDK